MTIIIIIKIRCEIVLAKNGEYIKSLREKKKQFFKYFFPAFSLLIQGFYGEGPFNLLSSMFNRLLFILLFYFLSTFFHHFICQLVS